MRHFQGVYESLLTAVDLVQVCQCQVIARQSQSATECPEGRTQDGEPRAVPVVSMNNDQLTLNLVGDGAALKKRLNSELLTVRSQNAESVNARQPVGVAV